MHMNMDLIFDMYANKSFVRVFYYKSIEALKNPGEHLDDCYTCIVEFDISKPTDHIKNLNKLIKVINISVNELLSK